MVAPAGVGLTVLPMEAAHGRLLTGTPGWYQRTVRGAFASLLLWTVAGIAGFVLGMAPFLTLAARMGTLGEGTALV